MRLEPFVKRLMIQSTEAGQLIPLTPNWAQREYLAVIERELSDKQRARIIILKARQLGLSTITEACMFALSFMIHRYRGLVLSHDNDSAQHLLSMTQTFWDEFWAKELYDTKYEARNMLSWAQNRSQIRVATANNTKAGRSKTIDFLHASEVAFWDKPFELMTGMSKSIHQTPGTVIVLESTANGRGNYFHQMWEEAVTGENDFIPLFFPWHKHPEYTASFLGLSVSHLLRGGLTEDERVLRRIGVDDDHLAWRRWAIRNLCSNKPLDFMQEYPTTPEEAFISTGSNVFADADLKNHFAPVEAASRGRLVRSGVNTVKFTPDSAGPLTVFSMPASDKDWGQYIIGGDPSRVIYGDYAVAQVLNRRTMEQVAVWRGKSEPGAFASELVKLGMWYNQALICPEKQGAGYMTIGKLLGLNYPNIIRLGKADKTPGKVNADQWGWDTNVQTKHEAIGWLLEHFTGPLRRDEDGRYASGLLVHDRATYSELVNYVALENGGYGNGVNEKHDDTVMALAIAVTCHEKEPPLLPYRHKPPTASSGAVRVAPQRVKEADMDLNADMGVGDDEYGDEYADTLHPHFMRMRQSGQDNQGQGDM
jgi:hypothetical protein